MYTSGATSGILVADGNGNGTNNAQLNLPVGIHFDSPSNSLFVANYASNNVVQWVLGANSWMLVAGSINGSTGSSPSLLNRPTGVTTDPMGNIYVADKTNQRIQFFYAGQSNGTTIAGGAGFGSVNNTFLYFPSQVKLDNQLNLYVTDQLNHRAQKFLRY